MAKKAFITGVTGQDGAHLSQLLLEQGYEVHGLVRGSSLPKLERLELLLGDLQQVKRLTLHYGDVTDSLNLTRIIGEIRPDEIYNLAGQTHVRVSFETPEYTADVNALGTLRILEAVRTLGLTATTRIYQASTSELFGSSPPPQNEQTPFCPQSPYGVAKLFAYWTTVNYRHAYQMFASNGILFNHESGIRGHTFVTRKITMAVSQIALGRSEKLFLGNLDAQRDWGYAKDYAVAMWKMMQLDAPLDLVIATGEAHTVREFCTLAFAWAGITLAWEGRGPQEKGYDQKTGQERVAIDPRFYRPTEVDYLLGDAARARKILHWEPTVRFHQLVELMMQSDFDAAKRNALHP